MPFYEIVFETGRSSVAQYDSDEEAFSAAGEQDKRAREGQQAGPQGGPAERVAKLYKYDRHPNDYNVEQTMSADVAKSEIDTLITALTDANGVVAVDQLAAEVRGLSHPMVTAKESAHDSNFKMQEATVLTLPEAK